MKIVAIYKGSREQDSGNESVMDYCVHEFTNVSDEEGNLYGDKWIKQTRLLMEARLKKGKMYEITLSSKIHSKNSRSMPYPIQISWGEEKVYIKNNNSVIHVDKDGNETNLSRGSIPRTFRK